MTPVEGVTHGAMNGESLIHVDDDKVIVSVLGTGELAGRQLGRLAHEAQHGADVCLPLGYRDVAPARSSE